MLMLDGWMALYVFSKEVLERFRYGIPDNAISEVTQAPGVRESGVA